jgi:hypothetical protein
MSRTVTRAEYELDKFLEENPSVDKSFKPNLLELLEIFAGQGHSGMSAGACLSMFKQNNKEEIEESSKPDAFYGGMLGNSVKELLDKFQSQKYGNTMDRTLAREIFVRLAKQENITPITCSDDEWGERSSFRTDKESYQNRRLSSVFKEGKDGKPYFIDAIIWREEEGSCYTGRGVTRDGEVYRSRQYIKLPFEPRRFYIDVVKEILPDDWTEEPFIEWDYYDTKEFEETGVKNWKTEKYRNVIKDEAQLEEVFDYYERFE